MLNIRGKFRTTVLTATALVASLAIATPAQGENELPSDYFTPDTLRTAWYDLGVQKLTLPIGSPYVTADGTHFALSLDWDFELGKTDINTGAFQALGELPLPAGARVLDFQRFAEWPNTARSTTTMVSYVYFDTKTSCRYSILREAQLDLTGGGKNLLGKLWFKSTCFPNGPDVVSEPSPSGPNTRGDSLINSGGRMALVPPSMRANAKLPEFFFPIGDFFIASDPRMKLAKEAKDQLSTIIRITAPRKNYTWARGLRNTQGLSVVEFEGKKALMATTQGPRGGDLLVNATKGANFGWPSVSYGSAYEGGRLGTKPDDAGTQRGFDIPLFAWDPSIGLSDMIQLKGPAFNRWWISKRNATTPDLMLAGMGGRLLQRVRIDQGAVRYVETIPIASRMRSIAQMPSGVLLFGLDAGNELLVVRPTAKWDEPSSTFVP